jgi:hypothetical protein
MAQRRTFFRSNYWAPVIARERSIVLAIAWYIGVELLRTKQLPQYITYTGIGRVPCLRADIQKQAARVYTNLFRKDDIVNKFYVADTGKNHLDGKVGVITSYDTMKCRFGAKIGATCHTRHSDFIEIPLSPENMEPYRRIYTPTHIPCPSAETCTIRLENHFRDPNSVLPCVTFHSDVFTEIGGITASPHTGGQAQQDRLVELIKTRELIKHAEAEKLRSQQAELERGLSKLYATRSPVELRPKKKIRQTHGLQNVPNSKQQISPRALQVKSVWKAKIEHIVSRSKNVPGGVDGDDNDVHEHMFTYPFRTVDNSLHHSCVGLPEFNHYRGTEGLNDAVYGRNDIASSIIIDGNSVSSVTPGRDMDDNIMNFCLSW